MPLAASFMDRNCYLHYRPLRVTINHYITSLLMQIGLVSLSAPVYIELNTYEFKSGDTNATEATVWHLINYGSETFRRDCLSNPIFITIIHIEPR